MKACKECVEEKGDAAFDAKGRPRREAKYAGPRCYSHHRQSLGDAKERAWGRRIWATYGLRVDDYWRIYRWQGNRCFICQRATGKAKKLAIDHDHASGYVRGILCGPCNQLLGHCRDDVMMLERAANYLRSWPSCQLGILAKKPEAEGG